MADCRKCSDFDWCLENEDCGLFKPKQMTNADRIRTMPDEELAKYFSSIAECDHCQNELDRECCVNEDVCINRWLEWLKSEA